MMFKRIEDFEEDKIYYLVELGEFSHNQFTAIRIVDMNNGSNNMFEITDYFGGERLIRVNGDGEVLDPSLWFVDASEMNTWVLVIDQLRVRVFDAIINKLNKFRKKKSKKDRKLEEELLQKLPPTIRPIFADSELVTSIEWADTFEGVIVTRFKRYKLEGRF